MGFKFEGYIIPFHMNGTTAAFTSRIPTSEEMDICTLLFMSDTDHWDP